MDRIRPWLSNLHLDTIPLPLPTLPNTNLTLQQNAAWARDKVTEQVSRLGGSYGLGTTSPSSATGTATATDTATSLSTVIDFVRSGSGSGGESAQPHGMFTLNISRSPATKEYFSGHDDSDSDSTSSAYDEVDDDGFVVVERRGVGIAFLSPRLYPLSPTNSPTRMAKSTFQGTSTSRLRVGHGIETASPAADRREAARRERRDAERRHVKAADDLLGAELEDVLEGSEDERRGRAAE